MNNYLLRVFSGLATAVCLMSNSGFATAENREIDVKEGMIHKALSLNPDHRNYFLDYEEIKKLESQKRVAILVSGSSGEFLWKGVHPADGLTVKGAVLFGVDQAGLEHYPIDYGFTRLADWPTAGFLVYKRRMSIMSRLTHLHPDDAAEFQQIGAQVLMPGDVVVVTLLM